MNLSLSNFIPFDYLEILYLYKRAQFSCHFLMYLFLIFTTAIPEAEEKNDFPQSQELADGALCCRFFDSRSHAHLISVH